jgi:hypothetical protein
MKSAANTNHIQVGFGVALRILNPAPRNTTPAIMLRVAEIFRVEDETG